MSVPRTEGGNGNSAAGCTPFGREGLIPPGPKENEESSQFCNLERQS